MSESLGQQWEALLELCHDHVAREIRAQFALAHAEGRAGELEGELLWATREFNRLALTTTDGATYEAARQAVTRLRRFLATPPPEPLEPPQWLSDMIDALTARKSTDQNVADKEGPRNADA